MGNYVFTTKDLVNALREDAANPDSKHDMGGNIIPWFVERGECGVYDFQDNDVPVRPTATAITGATLVRWTPTTRRTWT